MYHHMEILGVPCTYHSPYISRNVSSCLLSFPSCYTHGGCSYLNPFNQIFTMLPGNLTNLLTAVSKKLRKSSFVCLEMLLYITISKMYVDIKVLNNQLGKWSKLSKIVQSNQFSALFGPQAMFWCVQLFLGSSGTCYGEKSFLNWKLL